MLYGTYFLAITYLFKFKKRNAGKKGVREVQSTQ